MHIVRLKISGFRGVRSADIALGRHAVLVGPNNSGKTTVIEALALLFGRDRLVRRRVAARPDRGVAIRTLCGLGCVCRGTQRCHLRPER